MRCLRVFGNSVAKKEPKYLGNFWAISIYVTIILKVCGYFLAFFREIRQLFISSSGHTADDDDDDCDVKEDHF